MRVDKWIWSVCLVKNRTLATKFCSQGQVTVNGFTAKPSKSIALEDEIIIQHPKKSCQVIVKKFAEKPVNKSLAPLEYFEDKTVKTTPHPHDPVSKYQKSDFRYRSQKDGRVSKKDKRARQQIKNWET